MKKRGMSTRIGAIILAASMVVGDAAPTLAAQPANVDEDAVVSAELVETTEAAEGTESSETTEASGTAEETEAAETSGAAENSEAAETSEAAEASETTEASVTAEETETTEAEETEAAETTEAVETTEISEETEAADADEEAEEEDVILGSEVGVSQVIGLEGDDSFDGKFTSDDGKVTKEFEYVMSYKDMSDDAPWNEDDYNITVAGAKENYLDATGLYKYNNVYYVYAWYNEDKNETSLYGKVASYTTTKPVLDSATGLYKDASGKFYADYGTTFAKDADGYDDTSKPLVYYFVVDREIEALGVVETDDVYKLYGKKLADTDDDYAYYDVNGRYYRTIGFNWVTDTAGNVKSAVYAEKAAEISFDKKHHDITWNPVTNPTEISANGKLYHIGYQVKVNGVAAELEYGTGDGQTFTTRRSFESKEAYAPGTQAVYEVRAVYYTQTKKAGKDEAYDYVIAKTGDWSAAYAYSFEAAASEKKVSPVTNLNVAGWKKRNQVELNWSQVAEASSYEYQVISTDVKLADMNDTKNWENKYVRDTDSTDTYEYLTVYNPYTYIRMRAVVDYDVDDYAQDSVYEEDGEYVAVSEWSAPIEIVKSSETVALPTVALKVENQNDGTFDLTWDKMDLSDTGANGFTIYYSTDASVFASNEFKAICAAPTYKETELETYSYCVDDDCDDYGSSDCSNPEHYKKQVVTKSMAYTEDDAVSEAVEIVDKNIKGRYYVEKSEAESSNSDTRRLSLNLTPGKKYYFVAVLTSSNKADENRADITPYVINNVRYGYFNDITVSSQVSATVNMPEVKKPSTKSEKTSITMTFEKNSTITGYQIYRKNSKGKYKKIATTTSGQYVDKELKESTTYSYKARAYVYDTVTKKTVYSDYVFFSAETSTNNYIDLTAVKASKNSVKLTWTKVAGATKYEVYRTSTASTDSNKSEKTGVASNAKWKLVKTITKAKTVKYTDKKLNAGETYSYKVIAYYNAGKDTKKIETENASVTLKLTAPQNVVALLKGSTVNVTWDADKYATKYEVRYTKHDAQGKPYTDEAVVASTKKAKYSIKGLKAGEYVTVSVRATNGKQWTAWTYSGKKMSLPAVTSVSAKNVTVKDANGVESAKVKVSWKAVSGAAYYKVYRATSPVGTYNKDLKVYERPSDAVSIVKESNTDETYSTVGYDDYKGQPGTIVGTSAIDGGQLQTGVTYYYYVEAYAENGTAVSAGFAKNVSVTFNATPSIKSVKAAKGKVTVKMNKVAGAKQYVVYRSTKKNKGYEKIGTTKKLTYVDKTAKKGKTYYYKVVAVGTNALKADFETEMSAASKKVKAK